MTFSRPDLLWLALAAVPVLALHLVRRRRRRQRVGSLLLWDETISRATRRLGIRALAGVLSLLMLLLAIGAGTLAAADPVTGAPAPGPRPLVLAIGGSARMQGERWRRAVATARAEIARKAPNDPVTVILVSDAPRVPVRDETDPTRLLAALDGARPALVSARWELAAPALADVVAAGGRAVAIGVAPSVPDGVAVRTVTGSNAGIAGFGVGKSAGGSAAWLRLAGDLEGRELVVAGDGEEIVRLPAAAELEVLLPDVKGDVSFALVPSSGPEFDDEVRAVFPARRRIEVGVVSDGPPDPFLVAALDALRPVLDADGSGIVPPDRLAAARESFDVLILAKETPPELLPGDYLILGPPPAALGLAPAGRVGAATVWERSREHPVTRNVDLAEVQLMGAVAAKLPEDAEPLFSVGEGAVAAAGERDGVRWVWIGLGAGDSTLPVTGAWPLLIRNALRWFAAVREEPLPPAIRAGTSLFPRVPLPAGVRSVSVEGPGDRPAALARVEDGRFRVALPAGVEGEVRVRIGARVHRTFANVILPEETEARATTDAGPPPADRSGLVTTERRLWPWLAAVAAGLLLLEWAVGRWVG